MEAIQNEQKLKLQAVEHYANLNCGFDFAATLTFRHEPSSVRWAQGEFRQFMNWLNCICYGQNWFRKAKHCPSKRVAVIPVLEDGFGTKRLHYHCAFARPSHIEPWKFALAIDVLWSETRSGSSKHNKIVLIDDLPGWLDYITKEVFPSIPETNDKIDVLNMYVY